MSNLTLEEQFQNWIQGDHEYSFYKTVTEDGNDLWTLTNIDGEAIFFGLGEGPDDNEKLEILVWAGELYPF